MPRMHAAFRLTCPTTARRRALAFLICLAILGAYSVAIFNSNDRFRRLVEPMWFAIRNISVRGYFGTAGLFGYEVFATETGEWELWTEADQSNREESYLAAYPLNEEDYVANGLIWLSSRETHLLMPTSIRHRQRFELLYATSPIVEERPEEWRRIREGALQSASSYYGVSFSRLRNVDEAEWVELRHPFGYVHNTIIILTAGCFVLLSPFVARDGWRARRRLSRRGRKRFRLRHGLCPNCAYPIRKLPRNRCPECGTIFPARAIEPEEVAE